MSITIETVTLAQKQKKKNQNDTIAPSVHKTRYEAGVACPIHIVCLFSASIVHSTASDSFGISSIVPIPIPIYIFYFILFLFI